MADTLAWYNYNKIIGGTETTVQVSAYCKGFIGGLEALFQNFNNSIDECKVYIEDIDKKMQTEEDENGN